MLYNGFDGLGKDNGRLRRRITEEDDCKWAMVKRNRGHIIERKTYFNYIYVFV